MIQESLIFFPTKLPQHHQFHFDGPFEEQVVSTKDGINLHGVLFKAPSPKGVILYLHGNAGALNNWGELAPIYTNLNYDLFILDYRGYGKSEGHIHNEQQFYSDVQSAYDHLATTYPENKINILGYSIGTAAAAKVASENNPGQLILLAPFYSLTDLMHNIYPFLPGFILKYKFKTHKYLKHTNVPVTIFHGNKDEVIYYGSSLKLKKYLKASDLFFPLEGQGHNGMDYNASYQKHLKGILND